MHDCLTNRLSCRSLPASSKSQQSRFLFKSSHFLDPDSAGLRRHSCCTLSMTHAHTQSCFLQKQAVCRLQKQSRRTAAQLAFQRPCGSSQCHSRSGLLQQQLAKRLKSSSACSTSGAQHSFTAPCCSGLAHPGEVRATWQLVNSG